MHRAYADAAATAEVLHALLERAAGYGVLGLDDLVALPKMRAHPSAAKLALTARLPRAPGVYLFRDRDGRVLYVGKATNLRARVRSYFAADDRRKVPQLLREIAAIDHRVCASAFEAEIRELRLIRELRPRFNRQGKTTRAEAYLKLTNERFPRLTVTRTAPADDVQLGPFASAAAAHVVREAIESAVPLRRCTTRLGAGARSRRVRRACPRNSASPRVRAEVTSTPTRTRPSSTGRSERSRPNLISRSCPLRPGCTAWPTTNDSKKPPPPATGSTALDPCAGAAAHGGDVARVPHVVLDLDGERIELRHGRVVLDGELPHATAVDGDIAEILTVARFVDRYASRARLVYAEGELASAYPRADAVRAPISGNATRAAARARTPRPGRARPSATPRTAAAERPANIATSPSRGTGR